MLNIIFVSVVRDFEMYDACLTKNPNCSGAQFYTIDNREKNEFISVCYNRFLNQCDLSTDQWIVFCHEDFEPREHLSDILENVDSNSLYGPIDAVTKCYGGIFYKFPFCGRITASDRRGNNEQFVGRLVPFGTRVETFDCQCLIVHSSLLRRTTLRFDEHLSYDLYVEDFCMQAKENHGVPSLILPFKCKHWSNSAAQARYAPQLDYLKQKWPTVCYCGTCARDIGGGAGIIRRFDDAWKKLARKLFNLFSHISSVLIKS